MTQPKTKAKKPAKRTGRPAKGHEPDWRAIRRDYETGVMSLASLATKHHVSKAAISQRSNAEGWQRDLTAAVKRATQRRLAERAAGKVNEKLNAETAEREAADTETVEAYSNAIATVIERHRRDITTAREHVVEMSVMARSHAQQVDPAVDAFAADHQAQVDAQAARKLKKNERRLKPLSHAAVLGMRLDLADKAAAVTAKLVGSLEKLIKLEREAYNLNSDAGETDYDEEIRRLTAAQ